MSVGYGSVADIVFIKLNRKYNAEIELNSKYWISKYVLYLEDGMENEMQRVHTGKQHFLFQMLLHARKCVQVCTSPSTRRVSVLP